MTFNEALEESMTRVKDRDRLKGHESIYNEMLTEYHRYIKTENVNSEISKKMVKDIDNYFVTIINPLRAKIVESRHKHDEFWKTLNYQERMDFRNQIFKMVQDFYGM